MESDEEWVRGKWALLSLSLLAGTGAASSGSWHHATTSGVRTLAYQCSVGHNAHRVCNT